VGKTIEEANIDKEAGSLLLALRREGSDKYHFNPSRNMEIMAGDFLYLIASVERIKQIEEAAGKS
jgi:Trk K+ transport system NAD-binding subunit